MHFHAVHEYQLRADDRSGGVFYPDREDERRADHRGIAVDGRVNYIEQRVFLFNDTLRSNITMYRDYDLDEIENAVRLAGLKELVDRLPQHLETLVEGNGVNFSGGEMQRIAIARAILAKSRFIIFDEATANMDTALAREIEEIIMNLEHTGIIYITHHQSEELLRAADHVLTMKDWCIL